MARRAKGEGSIFVRKDGRIVGQYFVDGKPKSIYGRTKKEVKEKLDKALEKVEKKIDFDMEKSPFIDWLNEWLEYYAKINIKLSTYVSYEGIARAHIAKHSLASVELGKLNNKMLQKYFAEKSEFGRADKKAGGLAPKTLKNHYSMLHEALEQAVTNGYIMKNPIEDVRLPRIKRTEMRVLSRSEQKILANTVNCSDTLDVCGVHISLNVGLRIGETLALRWRHVSFDTKEIKIVDSINRLKTFDKNSEKSTKVMICEPKTEDSIRIAPMTSRLEMILRKQFEHQKELFGNMVTLDTFVVTDKDLNCFEPRRYQKLFDKFIGNSGIEHATFHSLRHTFATRCLEAGMDVVVLSKILGHASPDTTMKKYGHALKEEKIASIEKLNNVYEELGM